MTREIALVWEALRGQTEHSRQKPIEKRASKAIVSRKSQGSMAKSYQISDEDFRRAWFEEMGARMKTLSFS